jgi:hypothetical protein
LFSLEIIEKFLVPNGLTCVARRNCMPRAFCKMQNLRIIAREPQGQRSGACSSSSQARTRAGNGRCPVEASKQAIAIWRGMPVLKKELLAPGGSAQ